MLQCRACETEESSRRGSSQARLEEGRAGTHGENQPGRETRHSQQCGKSTLGEDQEENFGILMRGQDDETSSKEENMTKIIWVLLLAAPLFAQQKQPPTTTGKAQTAKDCQAQRTRLEKLGEPWRELSAQELEYSFVNMTLCMGVDPAGNGAYKTLVFRMLIYMHARMGRFIEETGLENSFVVWDSDPAHR